MAKVSPARSYPELFRVMGSLLSLVFRTEDVWQRCNQLIETAEFLIRVSLSHSYNAGRAGLGWASRQHRSYYSDVQKRLLSHTLLSLHQYATSRHLTPHVFI
jgi:hypothetical protein